MLMPFIHPSYIYMHNTTSMTYLYNFDISHI